MSCMLTNYYHSSVIFISLEMARAAYEGGATYFYRINDDTELIANWANVFVQALNNLPFRSELGPLGGPSFGFFSVVL